MLCLNMIVKNESARIIRALDAAKPLISTFAILDTGSNDDTIAKIMAWSALTGIYGTVEYGEFHNFSQARNDALDAARRWYRHPAAPEFHYLLLQDADMELVGATSALDQIRGGEMYEVAQKAGSVSYTNPRILSIHSAARYVGVTHEYLSAPTAGRIDGIYFQDHADGANRANKLERDIKLLTDDLKTDPDNARSWFYLGNSYREAGNPRMALTAYERYMKLGQWDEELYIAQTYIGACHRDTGDESKFVTETLKAYNIRPSRGEALYDVAKFYREKGENGTAMVFVEKGVTIPRPDDRLFVNDFVHNAGFREEYSIAGFYQPETKEKAYRVTNGLALDSSVPEHTRRLARTNMVHYLPKLVAIAPTAKHTQLKVNTAPGFIAMNPSVCARPSGSLEAIVRTVNYRIDAEGRYMIGEKGCQEAPIITENLLIDLDDDLEIMSNASIRWDRPPARFPLVIGLEDMRLFWVRGVRCFVACVREQSEVGQCEQWTGMLSRRFGTPFVSSVQEWARISDGTSTEKNWGPLVHKDGLTWMYRLDQRIDIDKRTKIPCHYAVDNISGSSQWIEWRGGYLAVVHEAIHHPSNGKRVYQHRFAFYDGTLSQLKLSLPFVFQNVQIEFCAGLAKHPSSNDLVVSYGVRDEEAWLTRVCENDVAAMLWGH